MSTREPFVQLLSETNQTLREIQQALRENNDKQQDRNRHLEKIAGKLRDLELGVYKVKHSVFYIASALWTVILVGTYLHWKGVIP